MCREHRRTNREPAAGLGQQGFNDTSSLRWSGQPVSPAGLTEFGHAVEVHPFHALRGSLNTGGIDAAKRVLNQRQALIGDAAGLATQPQFGGEFRHRFLRRKLQQGVQLGLRDAPGRRPRIQGMLQLPDWSARLNRPLQEQEVRRPDPRRVETPGKVGGLNAECLHALTTGQKPFGQFSVASLAFTAVKHRHWEHWKWA